MPKFLEERKVSDASDDFTERVCANFLHAPEEELTALLCPSSEEGARRLQRARSFSTQYNLKTWVETQNRTKSVAPTIGDCIQRRDHMSKELDVAGTPIERAFSLGSAASYRWLRRFKRKWKASLQQCGAREHVPLEEVRKKALTKRPRFHLVLDARPRPPKPTSWRWPDL